MGREWSADKKNLLAAKAVILFIEAESVEK
jgi:hypothetical protein